MNANHSIKSLVITVLSIACIQCPVMAQWTVTNIHPTQPGSSWLYAASGNNQVGYVLFNGNERASIWSGTAGTWSLLDPAGSLQSQALGAAANQQVGWADVNGRRRASLWASSAASWVDLNPAGAWQSWAMGIDESQQVGWM